MTSGDEAQQKEAFENFLTAMQEDVTSSVYSQASDEMSDRAILQNRGQNVLTSVERKFFNEAIDKKGFDEDSLLPGATQDRIFEDLTSEHPLLSALGIQDLGPLTRIITSEPEGAAVWGQLFGGIAGQIGASFSEETVSQLKLTAFAVVPNDMYDLGPAWIERYVRILLLK